MKNSGNGMLMDRDARRAWWINQYRASGMGLKPFARRHGLRPGRLHYWVYQLPKPPKFPAPRPAFQEVRLPAAGVSPGAWSTEIGLPNGVTVRLARDTDVAWAKALIDSLRRPCLP